MCLLNLSASWYDAEFATLQTHGHCVVCYRRRALEDFADRDVCPGQAFAQCDSQGGVLRTSLRTVLATKRAHGIIALVHQGNTPARLVRF